MSWEHRALRVVALGWLVAGCSQVGTSDGPGAETTDFAATTPDGGVATDGASSVPSTVTKARGKPGAPPTTTAIEV